MPAEPRIFGDGSTDYEKYIHTQELFRLQKAPADWANEEELLFQTVHQSMEIWLKVVIQHCEQSISWMEAGNLRDAARFLGRAAGIIEFLAGSLQFPQSISPWDYHKIRMGLGKGSGQESPTFSYLLDIGKPLLAAFENVLKRHKATLDAIHQDPSSHRDLYDLTIAMASLDEEFMHWRYRHFQLVKRIIGDGVLSLKGIPASSLEKHAHHPMFADLWAVINRTTNAYNAKYRPQGAGGYGSAK